MQIDIGSCISSLLYRHSVVSVPGLGGFISQYKPVYIDHVAGSLAPPSKQISFDINKGIDDGILLEEVRKRYATGQTQAEIALLDFVSDVKSKLAQKETVVIPSVGRLLQDYEGKINFVGDTTNYNTEAYGLPVISFKPAVKSVPVTTTPPAATLPTSTWNREWNWWIIAGVLVLGILYMLFGERLVNSWRNTSDEDGIELVLPEEGRTNISPSEEQPSIEQVTPTVQENVPPVEETTPTVETKPVPEKPQSPPAAVATPTLRIRVGLYGSDANVSSMVSRLKKAGYQTYLQQVDDVTKVGVVIKKGSSEQTARQLAKIRQQFASDARIDE